MNKLTTFIPCALFALTVTSVIAEDNNQYAGMNKQLDIMSNIIKSSVSIQDGRKGSRITGIESTYLKGQGVVFTINSSSGHNRWGNFNFNFAVPDFPLAPLAPLAPISSSSSSSSSSSYSSNDDIELENQMNESVVRSMEEAAQAYEHAMESFEHNREGYRELREEQRDLSYELRDVAREKRDIEYRLRRADDENKKELKSELAALNKQAAKLAVNEKEFKVKSEKLQKKQHAQKIEQEKVNQEKLEEERKQKLLIDSGLEKPKVEIDAKTLEAQKLVEEKYGQAGSLAVQGLMNASAKDIEADPEMVDKVLQHISEMKVANELDKDKMKSLKSIDSLDKLTKEFLNFKNLTSVQLSTVGGGLDTNKISADLMPTTGSTFDLGSATRPWRKLYLSGGTLVVGDAEISGTEIAQLDGVTAGTATASKAVILDASSGITGLGTVSMTTLALSGEPITASATELNHVDGVTGNIQTALDSKATKAFAIAQAVALG